MNIFTDSLFLFVCLFALFYFNMPNVNNDNYLTHKLMIFISVFAFSYVTRLIKKIKNGCVVNPMELMYNCLYTAVVAVVGYSIYIDLTYMDWSKTYFVDNFNDTHLYGTQKYAFISLVIVVSTALIQLIGLMFNPMHDNCIKKQ